VIQSPELIRRLQDAFGLRQAHIAPTLGDTILGVAIVADLSAAAVRPTRYVVGSVQQTIATINKRVVIGIHNRTNDQELVIERLKIDTSSTSTPKRCFVTVARESDATTEGLINASTLQVLRNQRESISNTYQLVSGSEIAYDTLETAAAVFLAPDVRLLAAGSTIASDQWSQPIFVGPGMWLIVETVETFPLVGDGIYLFIAGKLQIRSVAQ